MQAVNRNVRLSMEEREAMLACWDGYMPHEFITTALHFLDLHMPRPLLLPSLNYLKRNKLTGKALADFILGECKNSYVDFQRRLTVAVYKDPETRLIAGKTFVV